jgi:hypothetical protein
MSDKLITNDFELRSISAALHRANKTERRERIATACLAGLIANPQCSGKFEDYADDAIRYADALIARLDKEAKP